MTVTTVSDTVVTAAALDRRAEGLNLAGRSLREELKPDRVTLLVFLRHFG